MLYRSTSLQVWMPYQKLWFSTHKYSFCVRWCVFKCRLSPKTQVCKRARVCALLSRQLPCCNVSRWEEPVECKEVLRGETLNSCSSVPSGRSPSFEQQLSSLILSLAFFLSLPPTLSLSLDSFPGDFFFALSSSLNPVSVCKNILTELPWKYFKTLLSISVCWKTSLSAVYYKFLL